MYDGITDCGGTLVTPKFGISAVHCFQPGPFQFKDLKDFTVLAGLEKLSDPNIQFRKIKQLFTSYQKEPFRFIPQNFGYPRAKPDLLIVEFNIPFELNKYIKPACLPQRPVEVGEVCYISGWGSQDPYRAGPFVIQLLIFLAKFSSH